ncbi:CCA tRNA nucleotidyltransferase [Texcoconibacillus texcoconensis]|uniref:tRNA nucleotidyltransferase (CCA-adding enzyme) n=1 Tax=Texcoconibacillus texcoconensis TaxID=1095777 RepID=A0A840QQJ8_9BACI|nr:CCA tRNA nucleotidyltransferase [Texcoconibacillus texcoconensis]MBB5173577.1 tRNA nucleotidyltransferase (CCA-adding enzyme) [Texcoconibacillus texcoconensis]
MPADWKAAWDIIVELENHGFSSFIVGGAVRDYVLDKPPGDIDIATTARVEDVQHIFPHVVDVGVDHGTVLVPTTSDVIEVTQFRGEVNLNDVDRSLREDLARRDFTLNAMALTKSGEIIDPFGGKDDLQRRVLRAVENPSDRFEEDPLRLLRALRFAHQYQLSIDQDTERAVYTYSENIQEVAVERIANELEKMTQSSLTYQSMMALLSSPVMQALEGLKVKELYEKLKQNRVHFVVDSSLLLWSLLSFDWNNETSAREVLGTFKRSKALRKDVREIHDIALQTRREGWSSWLLYQLGKERLEASEVIRALIDHNQPNVALLHDRFCKLPIQNKKELAVNGKMLIEKLSIDHRSEIGDGLRRIEKAVVSGEVVNQKEAIYEWLKGGK